MSLFGWTICVCAQGYYGTHCDLVVHFILYIDLFYLFTSLYFEAFFTLHLANKVSRSEIAQRSNSVYHCKQKSLYYKYTLTSDILSIYVSIYLTNIHCLLQAQTRQHVQISVTMVAHVTCSLGVRHVNVRRGSLDRDVVSVKRDFITFTLNIWALSVSSVSLLLPSLSFIYTGQLHKRHIMFSKRALLEEVYQIQTRNKDTQFTNIYSCWF